MQSTLLDFKLPAHYEPMTPGQVTGQHVGEYGVNIQRPETADPTFRVWLSMGGRFVSGKELTCSDEAEAWFAYERAAKWALTNSDADTLVSA